MREVAEDLSKLRFLETGFECSDPQSFHSSVHGGFRNRSEQLPCNGEGQSTTALTLDGGSLTYTREDRDDGLTFHIEFLSDCTLYDLVCRSVIPGSFASRGELGGEQVPRGSLLYHQHACDEGGLGPMRFRFEGADSLPRQMESTLYLRCEQSDLDPTGWVWVVHARAIATADAIDYLKGIDGRSVPYSGHPIERHVLMRRRELAAPIYDTQIQPHAKVLAGTRCSVGISYTLPQELTPKAR